MNTNKKSVKINEKIDIIDVESYKQYNCDMSENVAKKIQNINVVL